MYEQEKHIETISRILVRSVRGGLSVAEQVMLDEWLSESLENRGVYERLHSSGYVGEQYARYRKADYGGGWDDVMRKIGRCKTITLRRRIARFAVAAAVAAATVWGVVNIADRSDKESGIAAIEPGRSQAMLSMEGGIVVPLDAGSSQPEPALVKHGISAIGNELVYRGNADGAETTVGGEIPMHTLSVPRGGEYRIVLSDGTTVWLNSETSLRYPARFDGGERRVELIGEGYFDVARDEGKRFVVSTKRVDIAVLGTEFNVMSYAGDGVVETTLVNGRVNIITETRNVELIPGKQAVCDTFGEAIDIRIVDTRIYTAWKDGVFEFDGMPLESICKLLGRWYNVEFVFSDAGVAQKTFTGAARKDRSLLFILNLINDTQSIRYEMADGKIRLSMK